MTEKVALLSKTLIQNIIDCIDKLKRKTKKLKIRFVKILFTGSSVTI